LNRARIINLDDLQDGDEGIKQEQVNKKVDREKNKKDTVGRKQEMEDLLNEFDIESERDNKYHSKYPSNISELPPSTR
jgi:predicted RNA-binding protein with RPS1 domain